MPFSLSQTHIIYEDNALLVVNKPPNLLSVPGLREPDNLLDAVIKAYPNARVVHRLDMPTSGIIVYALNIEAQRHINKQFELRQVSKTYQATLNGLLDTHYGCIDAPMICDWENRPKQKIDWLTGKKAITYYALLSKNESLNQSCVELYPHTGRSHQLRLHMYYLGFPILGDTIYHPNSTFTKNTFSPKNETDNRLHLHAKEITLTHPETLKPLKIKSAVPF